MTSSLGSRYWPSSTLSSVTLQFLFTTRANEGTGVWEQTSMPISALTLVFPTGQNVAVTMDSIREAVLLHAVNSGLLTWYKPKVGTAVDAIRDALADLAYPASMSTSTVHRIYFDGEFGTVHVG